MPVLPLPLPLLLLTVVEARGDEEERGEEGGIFINVGVSRGLSLFSSCASFFLTLIYACV